jgi:xyloglucan-specific exo-beta-1,4-glucanase
MSQQEYLFAGSVYRSLDAGNSWTRVFTPSGGAQVFLYNNGRLLAGFQNGDFTDGVAYSDDNGEHWTQLAISDRIYGLFAVNLTTLLAGGQQGLYRSTDNGSTWNQVTGMSFFAQGNPFAKSGNAIYALAFNGNGGSNFQYLCKSLDGGLTWTRVSDRQWQATSLVNANGSLWIAASGPGSQKGIFQSTDNGASWTQAAGGMLNQTTYAVAFTPASIYAALYSTSDLTGGVVWRSRDGGVTWSAVLSAQIQSLWFDGVRLFAGGYDFHALAPVLYRSADDGDTWENVFHSDTGYPVFSYPPVESVIPKIYETLPRNGPYSTTERAVSYSAQQ